jgi:hypothetical protein
MDFELRAFFDAMFAESEDDRLARMTEQLNQDEFALPDSTGEPYNAALDVSRAGLLESLLDVRSEDAAQISQLITATRAQKSNRQSTRRQQIQRIIDHNLRGTAPVRKLEKLAQREDWADELENHFQRIENSVLAYVENCVQEVRP